MRYLSKFILTDLTKKMVFLSGPRQSGKSYLSKKLIDHGQFEYLNWDIRGHKKIILKSEWDKNKKLIILDELHKYRPWKNYLKSVYDEFQNEPPLLVTGSARLDTFRKSGDALTGRYFHYRLHPIDPYEGLKHFGEALASLMAKASKLPAVMWGTSIVGFGVHRYPLAGGKVGEICAVGFSSRKADISIYGLDSTESSADQRAQLGKHKMGRGCLYVTRLSDIDLKVLASMISHAVKVKHAGSLRDHSAA